MMEAEQELALKIKDTTATKKIFALTQRIRAVAGGTSASKTISILVWCIDYAQTTRDELISIVSESHPHLERGAIADFKLIMKSQGYWDDDCWHDTKHTYTFETGTRIEFFSVDKLGKAHGPRRDVLFVNECNHIDYGIVDQLITRTRKIVWLDWNPSEEFWFYTQMQPVRNDIDFITLTYLDNEALDEITIGEIESHKGNKAWWDVYGLGKLGAITTRIYTNWKQLDEVPREAKLMRRWLDYGYSNDPTAIGCLYKWGDAWILDEEIYLKKLSNDDIVTHLKNVDEPCPIIADSAEPKSNDYLRSQELNVVDAKKGPDSIRNGIQKVQSETIYVTSRSLNILAEYRKYLWKTDKDGNILNVPTGEDHHLDGIRYAFMSFGDSLPESAARAQEARLLANERRQSMSSTK